MPSPTHLREHLRRGVLELTGRLPVNQVLDPTAPDLPPRNVVVVTGPHRSGTTIMGTLLNQAPRTFVITEPFNRDWGLARVPYRYPYLTAADIDSAPAQLIRRFLTHGEGCWQHHGKPASPGSKRNREPRRAVRQLRPWGHTAVVKDPFLLLALGWVGRGLTDRPAIVTLRHPCAWAMSLQRRSMHPWPALKSFREQEAFADPVVERLLADVHDRGDLITTSAVTWAILARMLRVQLDQGANAHVVRMEDFSAQPAEMLRRVYAWTGLDEPAELGQIVRWYTGEENLITPQDRTLHVLRRNSAALATAWREQLPTEQQHRIRAITEEHAAPWYTTW